MPRCEGGISSASQNSKIVGWFTKIEHSVLAQLIHSSNINSESEATAKRALYRTNSFTL
jgi:hypothetical protein